MRCPKCGEKIASEWHSCPYCGADAPASESVTEPQVTESKKTTCLNCGKELASAWKSCPFCGSPVGKPESISPMHMEGPSAYPSQPFPPGYPMPPMPPMRGVPPGAKNSKAFTLGVIAAITGFVFGAIMIVYAEDIANELSDLYGGEYEYDEDDVYIIGAIQIAFGFIYLIGAYMARNYNTAGGTLLLITGIVGLFFFVGLIGWLLAIIAGVIGRKKPLIYPSPPGY